MITPQELRIGNWVLIEKDGVRNPWQISGLDLYEMENNDDDFYPITLTIEILEKCGFEKDGERHYTIDIENGLNGLIDISVYIGDGEGKYLFQQTVGMGYYMGINIPVQSLHQLQNLYYFFTSGKELNIQL